MKQPLASQIIKTYPPHGPMHQYRLSESTAFHCFRCGESKKSKLVVIYASNWDRLLCNGCYGRLLSIYEIKAGTDSESEKAVRLADALLALFNRDQIREAERLYQLAEKRATLLSENALKFVATSEFLSEKLMSMPDLDWSPAVIGLCKAVETEVVARIVIPLSVYLAGINIDVDMKDKDIGRITRFLADPQSKPPELGTFAHFLQTALSSETRRGSSPVIGGLYRLFSSWPNSAWLSNRSGLYDSLIRLTQDFRNRAAHLDALTRQDYDECRSYVLGANAVLWRLIDATQPHRK